MFLQEYDTHFLKTNSTYFKALGPRPNCFGGQSLGRGAQRPSKAMSVEQVLPRPCMLPLSSVFLSVNIFEKLWFFNNVDICSLELNILKILYRWFFVLKISSRISFRHVLMSKWAENRDIDASRRAESIPHSPAGPRHHHKPESLRQQRNFWYFIYYIYK